MIHIQILLVARVARNTSSKVQMQRSDAWEVAKPTKEETVRMRNRSAREKRVERRANFLHSPCSFTPHNLVARLRQVVKDFNKYYKHSVKLE